MSQMSTGAGKRPQRVIRVHKLPDYLGVKRTAVDQMIKAGKLHPFSPTGERALVVTEEEVAEVQAKAMARAERGR
jgi:hypothetical protein